MHTASPVEEGELKGFASGSFYGLAVDDGSISIPTNEAGFRYGLSPQSDLGFKIYYWGMAFDYNHAVILEDDFALSINPYLSTGWAGGLGVGSGFVNILADVVRTEEFTVTLGLKPGFFYALGGIDDDFSSTTGGAMGAMAGVRLDLDPRFSLMPTIDVVTPTSDFGTGWLYNVGVAVMF